MSNDDIDRFKVGDWVQFNFIGMTVTGTIESFTEDLLQGTIKVSGIEELFIAPLRYIKKIYKVT